MASGAVTKRLQSELMGLMMEPAPGVTAFPDGDSLTTWTATLTPDGDSAYAGCAFRLRLAFPGNYPVAPPGVRFVTRVWHPNVDYPSGAICLDLLKDAWSPSLTVRTLLISLLSLLDEPNNASPLNGEAARGWDDRAAFVATAKAKYEEEVAAGGGGRRRDGSPCPFPPCPTLPIPSFFWEGGWGGEGCRPCWSRGGPACALSPSWFRRERCGGPFALDACRCCCATVAAAAADPPSGEAAGVWVAVAALTTEWLGSVAPPAARG